MTGIAITMATDNMSLMKITEWPNDYTFGPPSLKTLKALRMIIAYRAKYFVSKNKIADNLLKDLSLFPEKRKRYYFIQPLSSP